MKLIKTSIEGLIILKSTIVNDNRGYFPSPFLMSM